MQCIMPGSKMKLQGIATALHHIAAECMVAGSNMESLWGSCAASWPSSTAGSRTLEACSGAEWPAACAKFHAVMWAANFQIKLHRQPCPPAHTDILTFHDLPYCPCGSWLRLGSETASLLTGCRCRQPLVPCYGSPRRERCPAASSAALAGQGRQSISLNHDSRCATAHAVLAYLGGQSISLNQGAR